MGLAASPTRQGLEGSTLHHDGHPHQKRARLEPPSGSEDCVGVTSSMDFPGGLTSACGSTAASQSTLLDSTLTTANPTGPDSTISIDMQAHLNRLALQTKLTEGKGTEDAYPRHIKNYENFWNAYQEGEVKKNPNHRWVNAHPIIGAKVSLFLQYDSTRNKVCISAHTVHSPSQQSKSAIVLGVKFQGPRLGKKASSSQSMHFNDTCESINTYRSMQAVWKLNSSFEIRIGSRFTSRLLPPMSPRGSRMLMHSRRREHQLVCCRSLIFHHSSSLRAAVKIPTRKKT